MGETDQPVQLYSMPMAKLKKKTWPTPINYHGRKCTMGQKSYQNKKEKTCPVPSNKNFTNTYS